MRALYDRKQKVLDKIFGRPDFQKQILAVRQKLTDSGRPVPQNGFSSGKEYLTWLENKKPSKHYLELIEKFKVESKNLEGAYASEELEKELRFADLYGYEFDRILNAYYLDSEDKDIRGWLENVVFFDKSFLPRQWSDFKFTRDEKSGEPKELWVRFFGYTTSKDIPWDDIKNLQKELPDYVPRNKGESDKIKIRRQKELEIYREEMEEFRKEGFRHEPSQSIYKIIVGKLKKNIQNLRKER